jgi:hypothetical protein
MAGSMWRGKQITSWQMGDREKDRGRDPEQDRVPRNLSSVTYFLQVGPNSESFHHLPIILSNNESKARSMAQAVESLPSKHEALSHTPVPPKQNNNKKEPMSGLIQLGGRPHDLITSQ